ncbi:MAG TPA: class I SAM-dependent rRNA methyltransferase [Candidatus Eisenbacteria bacterium]|nr:class I SAM-dependent rRNA methyltransferase [Candidatus Eisenbacteria bacterium]
MLRLKKGRDQRARTHPWIFKGDVADVSDVAAGDAVTVLDSGGRFVGRGLFNPRPALCCRIFTWVDEAVDAAWLGRRVQAAVAARAGIQREAVRLVWSEADGLPGLVVDRYGPALAVQCLTLGIARWRDAIVAALRRSVGDLPVAGADDGAMAALEGFTPASGWLDRPGPEEIVVDEAGVRLGVRPGAGQKTGLYLDQRENRRRAEARAADQRVLDLFCYQGEWALHAARGGAAQVLAVDSSAPALEIARRNAERNGCADRVSFRQGDCFDIVRELERGAERFGLVILDPPALIKSRSSLAAGARAYREINRAAMGLLAEGGTLVTCSCSHHLEDPLFRQVLIEAARAAHRPFRVLDWAAEAPDHPQLLAVPETHYLKCAVLQAI